MLFFIFYFFLLFFISFCYFFSFLKVRITYRVYRRTPYLNHIRPAPAGVDSPPLFSPRICATRYGRHIAIALLAIALLAEAVGWLFQPITIPQLVLRIWIADLFLADRTDDDLPDTQHVAEHTARDAGLPLRILFGHLSQTSIEGGDATSSG